MPSKRRDCRLRKCTTVLVHGGVWHSTSTPHKVESTRHKSGNKMKSCNEIIFFRVLHTISPHLRAHSIARSVTVTRSAAVQASSVAPRSRNPPTCRRRDSPISSPLFSIAPSPHHCRLRARQQSQSSPDPAGKDSATSRPILTEAGTSVMLSFQSRSLLLLADESSGVTVCMKLFRDFNLLAAGW